MLQRLSVPTRLQKEYISKYLNKNVQLEAPPKVKKSHVPYFPNVICKFYLKNNCIKGKDCIFSHDTSRTKIEENRVLVEERDIDVFQSPFQ